MSVFIKTDEPGDFTTNVQFLQDNFTINESNFSSIPNNSIVVMDDFSFKQANNKQGKLDFLRVVNYILRHRCITLIMIIHNFFSTNLSNDILYAPHLFLSYSNMGYSIIR